ncbi:MAG TPA: hypothetical protein VK638_43855 [Edaphobacter sp.]|nr:hypothetical protein [Edaphobacter sp.]
MISVDPGCQPCLRWDVFNAFNATGLGNPNGTIAASAVSAGRITSIIAPVRYQQLGLRIDI